MTVMKYDYYQTEIIICIHIIITIRYEYMKSYKYLQIISIR